MTFATLDSIVHQVTIKGYDITEYVLAGSTRKSLREPVGTWSLQLRPTILDNRLINIKDIEINSFVEIRLGRNSQLIKNIYGKVSPPIIMRGMVDSIDISENVNQGTDGSPQRVVTIIGRDLGKAIVTKSVFVPQDTYAQESINRQYQYDLLSQRLSVKKTPTDTVFQDFKTWVTEVLGEVFRDPLMAFDTANNLKFTIDVNMPQLLGADRIIMQTGFTLQQSQGSLFRYIEHYCPPPFIEMFIEDQEEKSLFKIRWAPFRNSKGLFPYQATDDLRYGQKNYWFDPTRDPKSIQISRDMIMSSSLRKTGNDRPTYFWCTQGEFTPAQSPDGGASTGGNSYRKPLENTEYSNGNMIMNPQYDFEGMKQFGLQPLQIRVPFWPKEVMTPSRAGKYIPGLRSPEPSPYVPGETRTRDQAIQWAMNLVGRGSSYSGYCERFCENAYGKQSLYPSAWANAITDKNTNNTDVNKINIGDLVFFRPSKDNKNFGHIGIYIGGGNMVSAETGNVKVSSLLSGYWAGTGSDGVLLFYGSGTPEKCYGISPPPTTFPSLAEITFEGYIGAKPGTGAATAYKQELIVTKIIAGGPLRVHTTIVSQNLDAADSNYFSGLLGNSETKLNARGKTAPLDADGLGGWYLNRTVDTPGMGSKTSPLTFTGQYYPSGAETRTAAIKAKEQRDAIAVSVANTSAFKAQVYGRIIHVLEVTSGSVAIGQKISLSADGSGGPIDAELSSSLRDTVITGWADQEICQFKATISGTKMIVSSISQGQIRVGQIIEGPEVTNNTTVVSVDTLTLPQEVTLNLASTVAQESSMTGQSRYGGAGRYTLNKDASNLNQTMSYRGEPAPVLASELVKESKDPYSTGNDAADKLLDDMTQWLYDVFRETDKKWVGTFEMIGNPFLKIGMEMVIEAGNTNIRQNETTPYEDYSRDLSERYYIEGVEHAWSIFPEPMYHSRVSVTRGVNIPEQTAAQTGIPYSSGFSATGVLEANILDPDTGLPVGTDYELSPKATVLVPPSAKNPTATAGTGHAGP